jgi:hypothetical protein
MSIANIVIHIQINGKDVRIQTATDENSKSSGTCEQNRERSIGSVYQGGGKKPPYYYPSNFFNYINDGELDGSEDGDDQTS